MPHLTSETPDSLSGSNYTMIHLWPNHAADENCCGCVGCKDNRAPNPRTGISGQAPLVTSRSTISAVVFWGPASSGELLFLSYKHQHLSLQRSFINSPSFARVRYQCNLPCSSLYLQPSINVFADFATTAASVRWENSSASANPSNATIRYSHFSNASGTSYTCRSTTTTTQS